MEHNTQPNIPREITVHVPSPLRYQLVYRQQRSLPFALSSLPHDTSFFYCKGSIDALRFFRLIIKCFGLISAIKVLLKLLTPSREFYAILQNNRIVHHAWVTLSHCRYYRIESPSAVIGPIWSHPSIRNQGLGTFALRKTINLLLARNLHIYYIDTSDDNLACQRLIHKCEFGSPVGIFLRGKDL